MKGNKDSKYEFPSNEKDLVHVTLGKKQFSPSTGKKVHKDYPQKFDLRGWKNFLYHPNGLEVVKIHHLPPGATTPKQVSEEKEAKQEKALQTARKALGISK